MNKHSFTTWVRPLVALLLLATGYANAFADMWLVGTAFNGWNEGSGNVQMTQSGNIYYWYGTLESGKQFAFFKDGTSWSNQRGPTSDGAKPAGSWESTSGGSNHWVVATTGTYLIVYYATSGKTNSDKAHIEIFDATTRKFAVTGNAFGAWNMPPSSTTQTFTNNGDGTYTLNYSGASNSIFKLSGISQSESFNSDWDDIFNPFCLYNASLSSGANTLTMGNEANMTLPISGDVTLTISNVTPVSCTLTVASASPAVTNYYVAGSFTNWGTDKVQMTETATSGVYTATINNVPDAAQFKFVSNDGSSDTWTGAGNSNGDVIVSTTNCTDIALSSAGSGSNIAIYGSGNLTFTLNTNNNTFSVSNLTAPTVYTYNVYVRNTDTGSNTAPYLYAYDGNWISNNMGSWAGVQGTTTEVVSTYTYYKFTFTSTTGSGLKVIANMGDNTHQTDGISIAPGNYYIDFDGTQSSNITPSYSSATPPAAPVAPDRYIHGNFGSDWEHNLQMTHQGDGTYTYERTLTAGQVIYFFASDLNSDNWGDLNGHRFAEGKDQVIYENRVTTCQAVNEGTYVFTAGKEGNYIFTYDIINNTMIVVREKVNHHVRVYVYDRNGQTGNLMFYAYETIGNTAIGTAWPGISFNSNQTETIQGQTWYYEDLDIEDDRFGVVINKGNDWQTGDLVISAFYDAWYIAVDTSKGKATDAATYYAKNKLPTEPVPSHWYIKADWGGGWQATEEFTAVNSSEFSVTKHLAKDQVAYMYIANAYQNSDDFTAAHRYAASTSDTEIEIGTAYNVIANQEGGTYKFTAPANKQYTFTFNPTTMKFTVAEAVGKTVTIHLEKTNKVTNPKIWAWNKESDRNGVKLNPSIDRPTLNELMTNRYEFNSTNNNLFEMEEYTSPSDGRTWYTWEVDNNICEFVLTRDGTELTTSNYGTSDDISTIQWRRSGDIFLTWDDNLGLVDQTRDYDTHAAQEAPTAARMLEGHYYVYFINTLDWQNAFIHAWHTNSNGENIDLLPVGAAKYPGERLSEIVGTTDDGHEVYLFDFGLISQWEGNDPSGILFSIGDATGGLQTSDFKFSNGGVYDYTGNVVLGRSLGYIITNGVVGGAPYTIEDDLIGVYLDENYTETYTTSDEQTHTSYGALYCKDMNMFKTTPIVVRSVQQTGQFDYIKTLTHLMDHMNGRYDQSNWVKLTLSSEYPGYGTAKETQLAILRALKNKVLTAGSVRGVLVNNINPHLRITHSDAGVSSGIVAGANNDYGSDANENSISSEVHTTNVYTTANLVGNQDGTKSHRNYFFVTPKPNEYAEITWAVAENVTETSVEFYIPEMKFFTAKGFDNEDNLKGYFTANLDMLPSGNTFTEGEAYNFRAIITLDESKVNTGGGSGIKRRINHGSGSSEDNAYPYVIHPLSGGTVVTGVTEVNTSKTVANVTYVNIAGMQSNEPFDGVNIVVTTYTDGTRSAVKVIK